MWLWEGLGLRGCGNRDPRLALPHPGPQVPDPGTPDPGTPDPGTPDPGTPAPKTLASRDCRPHFRGRPPAGGLPPGYPRGQPTSSGDDPSNDQPVSAPERSPCIPGHWVTRSLSRGPRLSGTQARSRQPQSTTRPPARPAPRHPDPRAPSTTLIRRRPLLRGAFGTPARAPDRDRVSGQVIAESWNVVVGKGFGDRDPRLASRTWTLRSRIPSTPASKSLASRDCRPHCRGRPLSWWVASWSSEGATHQLGDNPLNDQVVGAPERSPL